jgi:hypothetical protein
MRTPLAISISMLSAALAFVGARATSAPPPAPVPVVARAPAPRACLAPPMIPAAPAGAPAPTQPAPTVPAAGARQLAAYDRATALVARARAAGRWSDADAAELHPLLADLDDDERAEVFGTLMPAFGTGEVQLEVSSGRPF